MTATEPTLDVLEFLRAEEAKRYADWRNALEDLLAKQEAWSVARRALHEELAARARLVGAIR
jgi:hypothetical protein